MYPDIPQFKYFNKKDGGGESICGQFSEKDIRESLIIRDEATQHYYMLRRHKMKKFYDLLIAAIQKNKPVSWHEIIPSFAQQRFRMDIDISVEDPEFIALQLPNHMISRAKCNKCGAALNKLICDDCKTSRANDKKAEYILKIITQKFITCSKTILKNFNINPEYLDYIVCSSVDSTISKPNKYSYHIISNVYSDSSNIINALAQQIQDELPANIKSFNDINVCKKGTSSLRMCLATKINTQRIKKITKYWSDVDQSPKLDSFDSWCESLVTYISLNYLLIRDDDIKFTPLINVDEKYTLDNLPETILKLAQIHFPGQEVMCRRNNRFDFRRYEPGFCSICNRTHDSENSLVIYAYSNKFIAKCRRDGFVKSISL